MIASMLLLTRTDIKSLRITDAYSLHRVVYGLFEDIRNEDEKKSGTASGILYADKGGNWKERKILIVSNRPPRISNHGEIVTKIIPEKFLQYQNYSFEIIINPVRRDNKSGKIVAVKDPEAITQWFIEKAYRSWGFMVKPESFQIQNIGVQVFAKNNHNITQSKATLKGKLEVTDRERFIQSFKLGIGRGKAFGFGLLQLVPLVNNFKNI